LGYLFYGKFVEKKTFNSVQNKYTSFYALILVNLIFVPMNSNKNAFIQILNVAGVGPIFGQFLAHYTDPAAFILDSFQLL
jgi:carbon starvation protein CstA